MSLDDRKLEVLRAIVEDYVETQEPVGSKALVERHQLGVSPATVRNDMAVLEEEGYIRQPHTSAAGSTRSWSGRRWPTPHRWCRAWSTTAPPATATPWPASPACSSRPWSS